MTIAARGGSPDGLRFFWLSPALALTLAALFWSGSFVVGRALFLGELLSTPQILGAALVLAGLALIEQLRTPRST